MIRKVIQIKSCKDAMMWYNSYIGEQFYVISEDEYYWVREPAGYLNLVYKQDAELKGVPDGN